MREKWGELDLIRAVSMVAVVLIHVTSGYINAPSAVSVLGINLAFAVNQAARFSVPMFLLLSGVTLGLGNKCDSYGEFVKRRFVKIGVPYFIWCIVYYLDHNEHALQTLFHQPGQQLPRLVESILLGSLEAHLYFIIILLQLYLLYPLLSKWVERAPLHTLLFSFLVTASIQELYYFINFGWNLIPTMLRPYLWMLFPTWIFYFVLGIYLTRDKLVRIRAVAKKMAAPCLSGTILLLLLYLMESCFTGATNAIRPQLIFVTLAVFVSLFGLYAYISPFNAAARPVSFLARHSMTIYFSHVLILNWLRRYSVFNRGMLGMGLLFLSDLALSILFAWILDSAVSRVGGRRLGKAVPAGASGPEL